MNSTKFIKLPNREIIIQLAIQNIEKISKSIANVLKKFHLIGDVSLRRVESTEYVDTS